jgi:hypothetical protein
MRAGGEVEVVTEPAEQGVADRPPDEVQFVAGRSEALPEFVGDRRDPQQFVHGTVLRLREFAAYVGHRSASLSARRR